MPAAPSPMPMQLLAADTVEPAVLHRLFGEAFADYLIGPFDQPLAAWPRFLARQAVELAASRVAFDGDGTPLALALVAPRAGRWRLATMGAVPAARGGGAAQRLLDDLAARARAAGVAALELEVFAQNTRALRLYERHGFVVRHGLYGHAAPPAGVPAGAVPPAVEPADALDWLARAEAAIPDLPLQVAAAGIAGLPSNWTARRLGSAQLVFSRPEPARATVHSLVDLSPRQADAERLVRALRADPPAAAVQVPPLQRDDLGGEALARAGFERQPLHQCLMRLSL